MYRAIVILIVGISCSMPAFAQEERHDDTAAVLALAQLGAQMQLNEQRIVGLTLQGEAIDDAAMQTLIGLDRLQSLTLRDTQVTGEGLKALNGLSLLSTLSIHDTPLSDRDIGELAAVKSVTTYDLRGTKISGMGRQRLENLLRKAMRDATVRLHFGGFLGVSGAFGGERCELTSVVTDSAAAEAGIQAGDVIVTLDGQPIKDFSALAETVALTPPERPIRVVIERDGVRKTVSVSLRRLPTR